MFIFQYTAKAEGAAVQSAKSIVESFNMPAIFNSEMVNKENIAQGMAKNYPKFVEYFSNKKDESAAAQEKFFSQMKYLVMSCGEVNLQKTEKYVDPNVSEKDQQEAKNEIINLNHLTALFSYIAMNFESFIERREKSGKDEDSFNKDVFWSLVTKFEDLWKDGKDPFFKPTLTTGDKQMAKAYRDVIISRYESEKKD